MKKAILLTIILFNLFYVCLSFAEDNNPGGPPAQNEQKETAATIKKETKNEEKDNYHTLESLKKKQKWNYTDRSCLAGDCKNDQKPTREEPFVSGVKVSYGQVRQAVEEEQSPTIVTPEIPVAVRLSAQDINRVTCQSGEIRDVVYSKEKGMTVTFTGKDAYIKYKYIKKADKTIYPTVTEMYIICGDATYNLIAVPESIPSKTIQLSTGDREKIRKNKNYFSGMSSEKKIMAMIKAVYTDDIQESFIVEKYALRDISPYEELFVSPTRTVTAPGEGMSVKEYIIKIKESSKRQEIELDERDFIETAASPIALAIDKLKIKKGDTARMFICAQNTRDDDRDKSTTIKIDRGYENENITKTESKAETGDDNKKNSKQIKIKTMQN